MASSNAERRVTLRALFDSTEMRRGADDSERALKDLERTTDQTTDSMNRSLRTVDDGVSSSIGRGGALDRGLDDGQEKMTEFSDTAREEIPNALLDMQDGVDGAMEGLAGAFGTLGPAGTIVATVLAGAAVMVSKSKQKWAEYYAGVSGVLSQLEIDATTSVKNIKKQMTDLADESARIGAFDPSGNNDWAAGMAEVAKQANALGIDTSKLVKLYVEGVNPQTRDTYKLLQAMTHQQETYNSATGYTWKLHTELADTALDIVKNVDAEAQRRKDILNDAIITRNSMLDIGDYTRASAEAMERYATASERAKRALEQIPQRQLPNPSTAG